MAAYCPYVAPKPSLNSEPLKHLCKDDVLGHCKNKNCSKHHIITLVDDQEDSDNYQNGDYVRVDKDSDQDSFRPLNTLTSTPRFPTSQDRPFDEDGPGTLAAHGPRHDNDKDHITDVQILPTVDEVSLAPVGPLDQG